MIIIILVTIIVIIYYWSNYKEYYGDYDTNDPNCVNQYNFYKQQMDKGGVEITIDEYNNRKVVNPQYANNVYNNWYEFNSAWCPSLSETTYMASP